MHHMRNRDMKRKSIKKQLKSLIHVGKSTPNKPAPRKAIVEACGTILAKPEFKKVVKHIDYISIVRCVEKSGFRVTGRVVTKPDGKKYYKIIDDGEQSLEYYKGCIVHELSHIHWPVLFKYQSEALAKFIEVADSCGPINGYSKDHESKWRKCWSKGMPAGISHWSNELHSIASEMIYYPLGRSDSVGTDANRERVLTAYRELHGLV